MARGSGVVVTVTVIEAMPGVLVSMRSMCAAAVVFPASARYARLNPESHTVSGPWQVLRLFSNLCVSRVAFRSAEETVVENVVSVRGWRGAASTRISPGSMYPNT